MTVAKVMFYAEYVPLGVNTDFKSRYTLGQRGRKFVVLVFCKKALARLWVIGM